MERGLGWAARVLSTPRLRLEPEVLAVPTLAGKMPIFLRLLTWAGKRLTLGPVEPCLRKMRQDKQ